ncbi:MAG: hypothetical protein ABIF08_03835 [Nanoarchaeota archaeon]
MAGLPFGLDAVYSLATSQGYTAWINIGVSIILATIIGGVVLIILTKALSKWTGSINNYAHVFMVVLIVNIINLFGFGVILGGFISFIPFMGLILPVLIWMGLLKMFFRELSLQGVVILGVAMFILSFTLVQILLTMATSFIF